jgi:hypothetical protein
MNHWPVKKLSDHPSKSSDFWNISHVWVASRRNAVQADRLFCTFFLLYFLQSRETIPLRLFAEQQIRQWINKYFFLFKTISKIKAFFMIFTFFLLAQRLREKQPRLRGMKIAHKKVHKIYSVLNLALVVSLSGLKIPPGGKKVTYNLFPQTFLINEHLLHMSSCS